MEPFHNLLAIYMGITCMNIMISGILVFFERRAIYVKLLWMWVSTAIILPPVKK
jgi:hypothetical protein